VEKSTKYVLPTVAFRAASLQLRPAAREPISSRDAQPAPSQPRRDFQERLFTEAVVAGRSEEGGGLTCLSRPALAAARGCGGSTSSEGKAGRAGLGVG
jgi:hypothetical protein